MESSDPGPSTGNSTNSAVVLSSSSVASSSAAQSFIASAQASAPGLFNAVNFDIAPFLCEDRALPPHVPTCGRVASSFLSHGFLVVTPRSEVRLRTIRRRYPNFPTSGLLQYAVNHGIAFEVALPIQHLNHFLPQPVPSRPPCYEASFHDSPFASNLSAPSLIAAWREKLSTILARPHARGYLLRGGILWRLAVLAAPSLLDSVLSNVSSGVSMFGRHASPGPPGLVVESLEAMEQQLVLGGIEQQSALRFLWPPPAQFERCFGFYGEWNAECETWFQSHLASLNTFRPLTPHRWDRHLSQFRSDQRLNPIPVFNAAFSMFNAESASWHLRPVRHLD